MTKTEILAMAHSVWHADLESIGICNLVEFAELVAAKEREDCAKVCEELAGQQWVTREASLECSDAIRDRSLFDLSPLKGIQGVGL